MYNATFIHNDITWCADSCKCKNRDCYRHIANRIIEEGPNIYTAASFNGTEYCPSYPIKRLSDEEHDLREIKHLISLKEQLLQIREETKNMTEEEKDRYLLQRWD